MTSCDCSAPSGDRLQDADVQQHTDRLKALSNPVRLRMVDLIYDGGGEICVCEFTEHFDLSQPTISHHLKVLRDAGLIRSRQDGSFVYHRVVPGAFAGLSDLMSRFASVREPVTT